MQMFFIESYIEVNKGTPACLRRNKFEGTVTVMDRMQILKKMNWIVSFVQKIFFGGNLERALPIN